MEGNNKRSLFRSLWARDKEEKPQSEPEDVKEEPKEAEPTPEETAEEQEAARQKAIQQNKLDTIYKLYCKWCTYQGRLPIQDLFADWVKAPVAEAAEELEMPSIVQKAEIFRRQMMLAADKITRQIESAEAAAQKYNKALAEGTADELEPVQLPPHLDVDVHIQIPMGGMEAFVMIFPPFGDGAALDETGLNKALGEAGLASGIRRDVVKQIVEEQAYFKMFLVAAGRPPVTGEDGKIIEHVPRQETLFFEEDDQGRVDYKEQNQFRKIEEGDLICEIVPPQEGIDGRDVRGNLVKASPGKKADVPAGENTMLSEDGSKLLAGCNGYVSYVMGKFRVANQLIISGNVDMSVGNQDFLGDIIVYGDVISGFTLKATGNIIVRGTVEGAVLDAGGNIEIGDGMNGNNFGELHAGGHVRSPFLENVKIYAMGDIYTQSMIACQAYSESSICINDGIGVVIGGKLTARASVKARIIGSKAQRKTEIVLGVQPDIQEEKEAKEKEVTATEETRSLLAKNIQLLQMAGTAGALTDEQNAVLSQLTEQEALYRTMVDKLKKEIDELDRLANDYSNCFVECGTIFPPTKIAIAGSNYSVDAVANNSIFYYSKNGEILMRVR